VHVATVVLLHSPLVRPTTWGELPTALRELGFDVFVVDVSDDDEPPYAATYVARAAHQIAAAESHPPLALVGHSGAGPLLPQIGYAQRAARRRVAAYVFLDATLPRPGASRLDLLQAQDVELAAAVRAQLALGGQVPHWTESDLAATGLGAHERALVLAAMRPRSLAFYGEALPHPGDWPDAPCGYVQTSTGYDSAARLARGRGFAVASAEGGHFAALTNADALARTLAALIARL
jgi:hypothetical protein